MLWNAQLAKNQTWQTAKNLCESAVVMTISQVNGCTGLIAVARGHSLKQVESFVLREFG